MNVKRRIKIRSIISETENIIDRLESIKDEEDTARENMPESFENTDTYQKSEECSDILADVIDDINSSIQSLGGIL